MFLLWIGNEFNVVNDEEDCDCFPSNQCLHRSLLAACCSGKIKEIKRLVVNGWDIEEMDERGDTPLMKAVARSRVDVVLLLLEHGANIHKINLFEIEDVKLLELFINRGMDCDVTNEESRTLLRRAIVEGNSTVVHYFLHRNIDPNSTIKPDDNSLLRIAVMHHQIKIAELLLSSGARLLENTSENSVLYDSALHISRSMLELLLLHGGDLRERDREGKDLFEKARNARLYAKLEVLLEFSLSRMKTLSISAAHLL